MITQPITYAEDELPPDQQPITTANNRCFEAFITLLTDPHSPPTMAAVTGRPGEGKTIAISKCVQTLTIRSGNTILPMVVKTKVPTNATARTVAGELCKSLGERPPLSGNKHEIAEKVAEAIENNGVKLIFIDEADRLNRDSFDVVRYMFDRTGCRFVIVGLPAILRVIDGHEQFASRVGLRMQFHPPELDEVLDIILPNLNIPGWHYNVTCDADRKLGQHVWNMTRNFRRLRNLLDRSSTLWRLEKTPHITEETVKKAFEFVRTRDSRYEPLSEDYSDGPMESDSERRQAARDKTK